MDTDAEELAKGGGQIAPLLCEPCDAASTTAL
jgi:hypothetical protein